MKQPIPFGKYYLLERINVGGMAEVFKAKATGVEGFERLVAVKRILPSIAEDEEFITMFVDEAKIAVQLTHANIGQIFDLGRVEGSFFIALEYVHGKDLRAMFNRTRQRGELLPVPLSCYAIMKLCEGLDYAHNKHDSTGSFLNLVHRDVSPQNILVSYEGEVKIIDFGIAKAAGKVGHTQAGILKGKFGYMSPEQVLGLEIDRRSDVFGVGICLYELLTGERLFIAETDFATLEKVRAVDIMPPSTYNRRIPEELEQIVLRALARDRDLRYQTAMQLHDELQAFMHTSGNLFSRRDLSGYMYRVFADEIEKESARDHDYAQMDPTAGAGPENDLAAFDAIDPVSTVSALHMQPSYPIAAGLQPEARKRKSTLLGIPQAVLRAPAVPRLVPSPASVPPPSNSRAAGPQSRPPAAFATHGSQGQGMEWDEEELSTQLYDRPDDELDQLEASVPDAMAPVALRAPADNGAWRQPTSTLAGRRHNSSLQLTAAMARSEAVPSARVQKGQPMLMAIFAVVAIIACIVLGLLIFGQREPGTLNLTTQPSRVSVSVDGRSLGTSTSPFVIGELSAGKRHEITVSSPGYLPWSQTIELQSGQITTLPDVRLARIDTGFALTSEPVGASILIDGKSSGSTTPARLVDLTPGEHRVRFELAGYAAWESSLHASTGTVLAIPTVALQPLAANDAASADGRSNSSSSRWRRSSTGSSSTGSSAHFDTTEPQASKATDPAEPTAAPEPEPTAAPAVAAASAHEESPEEPTAPASTNASASANAKANDAPAASVATGKLRVNSRPWSQVFIDGKSYGPTPRMNIELSEGTHTLKLVNEEFSVTKSVEVTIIAGKTETMVVNLLE